MLTGIPVFDVFGRESEILIIFQLIGIPRLVSVRDWENGSSMSLDDSWNAAQVCGLNEHVQLESDNKMYMLQYIPPPEANRYHNVVRDDRAVVTTVTIEVKS